MRNVRVVDAAPSFVGWLELVDLGGRKMCQVRSHENGRYIFRFSVLEEYRYRTELGSGLIEHLDDDGVWRKADRTVRAYHFVPMDDGSKRDPARRERA